MDWEDVILFDFKANITSSSGALTADALGSSFTVGELIGYAIRYSDNMAYRLLFNAYGRTAYNAWVQKLGIPGLQIFSSSGYTNICADDLSRGMLRILQYAQTDSRLVDLLLQPSYTPRTASGVEYPVASKYGYQTVAKAYHEATIVFAPEPYVLVVMSRLDPTAKETASALAELARLVGQVHSLRCAS